MSKTRRKSDNNVPVPEIKDFYNPFPDLSHDSFYERQAAKSPIFSKRSWKCFQLVLICQKLLKPFSSSNKVSQTDITKEEPKTPYEFTRLNRPRMQTTILETVKIDTGVQTSVETLPDISMNVFDDFDDRNHGSEDFPYDVDESEKEPYWDLDIDSAIVGDFNSTSALSFDEQLDPHYATIKISVDGRFIDKSQCGGEQLLCTTMYSKDKTNYSNNSSPKSGIYSKIIKPKKIDYFNTQISDYYRSQTCARLNFENIMAIRNQLGLCRDTDHCYPISDCSVINNDPVSDTPDIPRRNYGSSVINYITKLRKNDQYQSSNTIPSIMDLEKELSSRNIYSPIWMAERNQYDRIAKLCEAPLSEPIAPKRSLNKILHQLNPTYRDDSSEDASSISFTSPVKIKYSYPRNFSENYSKKSSCRSNRVNYVNLLNEEINRFRHMDSEVDINLDKQLDLAYQRKMNQSGTDLNVPLDPVKSGEVHFLCDEKIFLQPLMERSCEEDYFNRDFLSSLDYINV